MTAVDVIIRGPLLLVMLFLLAACEQNAGNTGIQTLSGSNVIRHHDGRKVALGERVYREHCAVCHGDGGQGAPNWQRRGPDGFYPAPPLNGSGHEWHHSTADLRGIIKNGSPRGVGKMPGWAGKLTNEEIDAVIEWFQSKWPDPVFAAWFDMEQRSFGR